jgi:hypothetical protein
MQPLSSNPSNSASSSHTQETIQTSPNPKDKVEISTPTQQFESVSLSQTGEEIHLYTEAMTLLPDVRQERITEIQTVINLRNHLNHSPSYNIFFRPIPTLLIRRCFKQKYFSS